LQWLAAHFRSEFGNNVIWNGPLNEPDTRKDIPSGELDRWGAFAAKHAARTFYVIYQPIHIIRDSFPGTSEDNVYDASWIVVLDDDTTIATYHIGDRPNHSPEATPSARTPAADAPVAPAFERASS